MLPRRSLEFIIAFLWLLIAVSLFYVDNGERKVLPDPPIEQFDNDKQIEVKSKFDLKKVIVLSSNSFDLTLKDEKSTRILSKLNVVVAEDAKQKIIDLLNNVSNPQVRLVEKQADGKWVVEIFFILDGQDANLLSWLEAKNLIYK